MIRITNENDVSFLNLFGDDDDEEALETGFEETLYEESYSHLKGQKEDKLEKARAKKEEKLKRAKLAARK